MGCRTALLRGLFIFAILAAIFLTAGSWLVTEISKSPARARITQCAYNCKQIASGMAQFEEAHGRLPDLVTTIPADFQGDNYLVIGWAPQILPYLDRNHDLGEILASNEKTIGDGKLYSGSPPGTMFMQFVDVLDCPEQFESFMTERGQRVPLSYAVNAGMPDVPATATEPPDYAENGVFHNALAVALAARANPPGPAPIHVDRGYIAQYDGVSNTILLSENRDATFWAKAGDLKSPPFYFVERLPNPSGKPTPAEDFETPMAIVWQDVPDDFPTGQPPVLLNRDLTGRSGFSYQGGYFEWESKVNSVWSGDTARPSSTHIDSGFNVTFADGHTSFMSEDVAYQVYAQLMTPRGAMARKPGSGPVRPSDHESPNPSPALYQWQGASISDAALNR